MTQRHHLHRLAADEAGQHQLVHPVGQGRGGAVGDHRVGADRHRHLHAAPRPGRASRWATLPSLWMCQCMPVVLRVEDLQPVHPHVLGPAVRGPRVNTQGKVTKRPPSSGQQVRTGSRPRSTVVPRRHHLLARRAASAAPGQHSPELETGSGQQAKRLAQAARGAVLSRASMRRGISSTSSHAQGELQSPPAAEGVDEHRHPAALAVLEQQRLAAARALHRQVGQRGDLQTGGEGFGDPHEFARPIEGVR